MSGLRSFLAVSVPCAVLAGPARAGDVHIVNANGGGDFTDIQDAIAAAAEGDTILVKAGTYGSFVVGNKELAIVGDSGASVLIDGAVRARNLAAGKVVVLENLKATGQFATSGVLQHGLYLADNAGSVRIQKCEFTGANGAYMNHPDAWSGASVGTSADVSIVRSTIRGGEGSFGHFGYTDEPGVSGEGLAATNSNVTAHASTISGGRGGQGSCSQCCGYWDGGSGNYGVLGETSTLLLSGCTIHGGSGGWGCQNPCIYLALGGGAGVGLRLVSNLARVQASTTTGGTPGCDSGGLCATYCYPQLPGRFGGPIVDLTSPSRTLDTQTPVRESTNPVMSFAGQPGDFVMVFVTRQTAYVYRADLEGTLLVRPRAPHLSIPIGVVPASGALTKPLSLGDLGPGVESDVLYLQPLFVDTQGNRRIGSPSTMVVLDSAF